jgi:PAS domain S-box-containing protein
MSQNNLQSAQHCLQKLQQAAGVDAGQNPLLAEAIAELSETLTQLQLEGLHPAPECRRDDQTLLLLNLTNTGWWDWDIRLEHWTWSDRLFQLLGYKPQEVVPSIQAWRDRIHSDDLEWTTQTLQQDLEHQRVSELEYRVIHPDGRLHWLQVKGQGIYDAAGQPIRMVGIAMEMSDRKQLEFQLQEMSSALSNAAEGISRLDEQGRYVFVNQAYAELVGYTPAEMIGMDWQKTVYPADLEMMKAAYEHMLHQGNVEVEARGIRKDGSIVYKQLFMIIAYDQQQRFIGHHCFSKDISDRKQAELALQQQIRQESLLADIAQDIRQSLDLNTVLSRTVERVRAELNTDRVVIFRFRPDWQGEVIMESVGVEWLSLLATTIFDPCFREHLIEPYRQGRIGVIADINSPDLVSCYAEFLRQFQVKANLVVPILQGENLWGLLIVHHCSTSRRWQQPEIDLLSQLANTVGIAVQQSELYEQTRHELQERERMQIALAESEELFRTINAAAPVGIRQTNADGICLYTNARWQEMSGLSAADCLGDGWLQAVHPEDRKGLMAAWETYLRAEGDRLPEFRLLSPQGEIRWVSAQAATMTNASGEVIGYVSVDEDITERKESEQKIRQQATLLDIASDAILVRDLEHRLRYWNSGAEHIFGWSAAEALGQKADTLLQADPAQIAMLTQTVLEVGEGWSELHKKNKCGETVIVSARWTRVLDAAGQPNCILSVETDITAKKQLEAQFYQAQRLESLGTLASGIAHDLNNVLTPVLAVSQMLRCMPLDLDERSQRSLELLETSAKRGASLVKQILTFTRGTSGESVPLQIADLLEEVLGVVQQTFPKSIAIQPRFPHKNLWPISANPTHLHQVLMNLCVNARDAMPEGGVLSLSAENVAVDAAFAQMYLNVQAGNYVLVTVGDTGEGIAPAVRDRMFEPFFTTKPQGYGTGLGLSTVLGIVKSYGGFVQVVSELGQGSQFKIYLPATAPVPHPSEPQGLPLEGHGEWVLIVDDDPLVQRVTQTLLEQHHYQTLVAQDGMEAIALYQKRQATIQLVLLDVMMPNMDGIMTVQALKKINPQVPIIAMSGLPTKREPVLAAGATRFLAKPYVMEEMLRLVHDFMVSPPSE